MVHIPCSPIAEGRLPQNPPSFTGEDKPPAIPSPSMGEGQGEGETGTKGRGNPTNPQIPAIPGSDNNALDKRYICSNITTKRRADFRRTSATKTKNRRVETGVRKPFPMQLKHN